MLQFRNINISPNDPVEQWGFEGLLTAIERGEVTDWNRIYKSLEANPYGKVSQELEEAIIATEDSHLGEGVAKMFSLALQQLRSA